MATTNLREGGIDLRTILISRCFQQSSDEIWKSRQSFALFAFSPPGCQSSASKMIEIQKSWNSLPRVPSCSYSQFSVLCSSSFLSSSSSRRERCHWMEFEQTHKTKIKRMGWRADKSGIVPCDCLFRFSSAGLWGPGALWAARRRTTRSPSRPDTGGLCLCHCLCLCLPFFCLFFYY